MLTGGLRRVNARNPTSSSTLSSTSSTKLTTMLTTKTRSSCFLSLFVMVKILIPMSHQVLPTTEARVRAWIDRHRMLAGVRRLGIAVSGGSDSVAMLRLALPLCSERGVTSVVMHLDHGLRGAISAADARFVARLAKHFGVAFRMQTAGIAPTPNQSMEMAARAARQAFFRQVAQEERLDAIATGHTANDVAETLLLRLFRGGGATGLAGLRPVHVVAGIRYVRPLLDCSHVELRAWLRGKRQAWREDASNQDTRIPRNRIRRQVLPWLEKHGAPAVCAMLAQSAAILREEDALLEEWAGRELVRLNARSVGRLGMTLHVAWMKKLPIALQRRVVRQWLIAAGFSDAAGWDGVERILDGCASPRPWQVSLAGGVLAQSRDGRLYLASSENGRRSVPCVDAEPKTHELRVPGAVTVAGVRVTARRGRGIVQTAGPVGAIPSACSLDADALRGKTLLVRTRLPGDRIRPVGMEGSRKLQDLLVDAKIPAEERALLPVLAVGDEVVWVPGYRVAQAYAVRAPGAPSVRVRMVNV